MRYAFALLTLAAFVTGGPALAAAQSNARPRTTTTAHGPKPATTHAPKTTAAKGPKTTTARQGPKTTTARAPQAATHGNSAAKATKPAKPTSTTAVTTPATNLPRNPRLVERLRVLLNLPPGTDMTAVAAGFRNQGQFVAAVHVSNNLGLTFTDLKTLMVTEGLSLGQAIQKLRPGVNADSEARRATSQSQQ